ncbi:MAG: VWA domain-containing protein [Planctomycetes bacterium]|nr:VWA domain-containing protein [Planctomycetota bacterium]
MIVPFVYELRARGVPVGAQETVALAEALLKGLHQCSLDGFYHVARALLVHSEAHLDAFDEAFLAHFRGVEELGIDLHSKLLDWLKEAAERRAELSEEERALLERYDPEELRALFEQRLREQKERHDGGSKWIGTGGSSPFGHSGAAREGIRVGGPGGNRSAIQVADARRFRGYRKDVVLDVRQMAVALRKLREFAREGSEQELDLEATVDETARNFGDLEIVLRAPRRPNTRVILLMDVGGSMDPYTHLVERLFTAASKSTHFKELRCYYFHNCVYGRVYETESFRRAIPIRQLLADCGRHYKLVFVGDALMAPYELLTHGGTLYDDESTDLRGIDWLALIAAHFERSVWLNPEDPRYWGGTTIEHVAQVVNMFPLTLEGLGEAVAHLVRGRPHSRPA